MYTFLNTPGNPAKMVARKKSLKCGRTVERKGVSHKRLFSTSATDSITRIGSQAPDKYVLEGNRSQCQTIVAHPAGYGRESKHDGEFECVLAHGGVDFRKVRRVPKCVLHPLVEDGASE